MKPLDIEFPMVKIENDYFPITIFDYNFADLQAKLQKIQGSTTTIPAKKTTKKQHWAYGLCKNLARIESDQLVEFEKKPCVIYKNDHFIYIMRDYLTPFAEQLSDHIDMWYGKYLNVPTEFLVGKNIPDLIFDDDDYNPDFEEIEENYEGTNIQELIQSLVMFNFAESEIAYFIGYTFLPEDQLGILNEL